MLSTSPISSTVLTFIRPSTSSFSVGIGVPIPTLPEAVTLTFSILLVLITRSTESVVPKKCSTGSTLSLPKVFQGKPEPGCPLLLSSPSFLRMPESDSRSPWFFVSSFTEMTSDCPSCLIITFSPATRLTLSVIELIPLTTWFLAILSPVTILSAIDRACKL